MRHISNPPEVIGQMAEGWEVDIVPDSDRVAFYRFDSAGVTPTFIKAKDTINPLHDLPLYLSQQPSFMARLLEATDKDYRQSLGLSENTKTAHHVEVRSGLGNEQTILNAVRNMLANSYPLFLGPQLVRSGQAHHDISDKENALGYVLTKNGGTIFWGGEIRVPAFIEGKTLLQIL